MRTHYDNLHVSEKAAPEVIRGAYKALAQKWHPDKHPEQREKAERYFKIITRAFDILSDQKSRAKYDDWLTAQRNSEPSQPSPEPAQQAPKQHKPKSKSPPTPQQNAEEAYEDGRRSHEQGFKSSDCPYSGDLAGVWQQGFKAGEVAIKPLAQKPDQVKSAVNFLWASLAIGALRALFSPPLQDSAELTGLVGTVLVLTFLALGFLIVKISAGKNWARITFLVFFAVGFLPGLAGILIEYAASYFMGLLSVIQIVFQVVAAIMLFKEPCRSWFRRSAQL